LLTKPFTKTTNLDYSINALLSGTVSGAAQSFQNYISSRLPGKLWLMSVPAMHITIMDWISFSPDYKQDKARLFENIFLEYDSALLTLLGRYPYELTVEFNQLRATPDAIILIGKDDGTLANIRNEFRLLVEPLPATNPPPLIIHSSIMRYQEEFPLIEVEKILPTFEPIKMTVSKLYLQKFTTAPPEKLETIKEYFLDSGPRKGGSFEDIVT
jgi:hypothetical protein